MGENIYNEGGLIVRAFYGGRDRGKCLQFDANSAQLDIVQVEGFLSSIRKWESDKKYNTKEIASELSDFIRLLESEMIRMEIIADDDSNSESLKKLLTRIKNLREMSEYLYNAEESI